MNNGRVSGVILLLLGGTSLYWSLAGHSTPHAGAVTITALDIVYAIAASFGVVVVLFGIVLFAAGTEIDHSINLRRAGLAFLALSSVAYLAFQGPELVAVAFAKDRPWASSAHDVVNFGLLGTLLVAQLRDGFARIKPQKL